MTRCAVLALLISMLCMPATGAEAPGSTTAGLDLSSESLSSGGADWSELTLRITRDIAPRTRAGVALSRTRRFGLDDSQFAASAALPIGAKLVATVDAAFSPTHRVLARHALGGALQFEFAPAWLAHAGVKTTSYDAVRVNQGLLMLERYVGAYSAALAWRPTRAFGATAYGYSAQAAWYYGDKDSVGVMLSSGDEASSLPGGVVLGRVRAAALTGRHVIAPGWTFNYGFSQTRQVGLYTRKGINVGLAHVY